MLKKLKYRWIIFWHSLFRGMSNAESIINGQTKSNDGDIGIIQQIGVGGVFDDMLQQKETQEVVEMRDKYYRVYKESDKWDTSNITIIGEDENGVIFGNTDKIKKKRKSDFIKHPPVYNPENLLLRTIQDVKHIQKHSKKVENLTDIKNIASISSGDANVGELIGMAMQKVGKNGIISLEEGKQITTTLKLVEGLEFDRGFVSPYMATNQEKLTTELTNAKLLVTTEKITSINQILPLLEVCNQNAIPLLIIADDFEQEVITMLVVNKLRGNLNVIAVKAPSFAEKRRQILEDICMLTGATLFSDQLNSQLN
jgi:hypothetical protein